MANRSLALDAPHSKRKNTPRSKRKRTKTTTPTISDVRALCELYDDATPIDRIPNEELLRSLYNTLRKKFHPGTTSSQRHAATIDNIDIEALQIPEPVEKQLDGWLDNPWKFWGQSCRIEPQPFNTGLGRNANVGIFISSSWDVYDNLSSTKVLWRFNCVALCLLFMRWKPRWQLSGQLLPEVVQDFLSTFGCTSTPSAVKKTTFIIRCGQRRLVFLAKLEEIEVQNNEEQGDSAREAEDYANMQTLGILFLDDIPDSSFDSGKPLSASDLDKSTCLLRSKNIKQWLLSTDRGKVAIALLQFTLCQVWLDEGPSDRRRLCDNEQNPGFDSLIAAAEVVRHGAETTGDSDASRNHGNPVTSAQLIQSTDNPSQEETAETFENVTTSEYAPPPAFAEYTENGHEDQNRYWGWQVPTESYMRWDNMFWQPTVGLQWNSDLTNIS